MAECKECRRQVRGELRAFIEPVSVVADAISGGGLVAADVVLYLICPTSQDAVGSRRMEVEELFEHSCKFEEYQLQDVRVQPSDQTIRRPDKRSSRRWLGADVTIALQCPRCRGEIKVCVTVGDYAQAFIQDQYEVDTVDRTGVPMTMGA